MYHSYLTIFVPAVISFFITVLSTYFVINYFSSAGIVGKDYYKGKKRIIPSSGGVALSFGLIVGIMVYTFGGTFVYTPILKISDLLAASLSIMLITFVGFIDDLNVKSKPQKTTGMKDIRVGLKRWQKPLLTVIGAIPLMAINAGNSYVHIPLIGLVNLSYFYPLLVLPLAIIFVPNAVNLLGGFDGLQPGTTLVASLGFLIYCFIYGSNISLLLSAILFASILGFIWFNWYPSRIMPGDSYTYAVGATMVAIMVLGNLEFFGIIVFIPWIIEFLLHARKRFDVTDLGIRRSDGTLEPPYGKKIYSLTHMVMNMKRAREWEVSIYLSAFEAIFVVLAFILKALALI